MFAFIFSTWPGWLIPLDLKTVFLLIKFHTKLYGLSLAVIYLIHSWISHRNFKVKCKNCQRKFIPHHLPFVTPTLKFSLISVSDTASTHLLKVEMRSHLWLFPFPDSDIQFTIKACLRCVSNSSTLFHYFSLSHHHLSSGYKRLLNGLVCILIPTNPSSHFLHDILFFSFLSSHPYLLLIFLC